jgi:hypothetical protein
MDPDLDQLYQSCLHESMNAYITTSFKRSPQHSEILGSWFNRGQSVRCNLLLSKPDLVCSDANLKVFFNMIELRINWVLPVPGEEVLMVPKGIPCKLFSSFFKQRNVQTVPCDVRHWSLCMTNCMRTWRHARRSRIPAQVQYIELHCQKSIAGLLFLTEYDAARMI